MSRINCLDDCAWSEITNQLWKSKLALRISSLENSHSRNQFLSQNCSPTRRPTFCTIRLRTASGEEEVLQRATFANDGCKCGGDRRCPIVGSVHVAAYSTRLAGIERDAFWRVPSLTPTKSPRCYVPVLICRLNVTDGDGRMVSVTAPIMQVHDREISSGSNGGKKTNAEFLSC